MNTCKACGKELINSKHAIVCNSVCLNIMRGTWPHHFRLPKTWEYLVDDRWQVLAGKAP